ncbi:uncharacterized protein [Dysidea avara]|uniref:uncharacterized protein n=1 Tax=Dysidea avara TaxID=196820 RepID=UPI00331FDFAF
MSASYDKSQPSSGRPGGFVTIRPLISGQTRTTILQCPVSIQATPSTQTSIAQTVDHTVSTGTEETFAYSVMIIPKKKNEFTIEKVHGVTRKFSSLDELTSNVFKYLPATYGYVEPGHGSKGKRRWLTSENDLTEMYNIYNGKKEILLWCSKEKHTDEPDTGDEPSNKRAKTSHEGHIDKMAEVETIEDKLREKHGGVYTEEQLRCWAHLIQMKKHTSYDVAPNKPFWKVSKMLSDKDKGDRSSCTVSPSKSVNLRGQCVTQLLQLHQLLERGGITQQQYDDMQGAIMGEVKKFVVK